MCPRTARLMPAGVFTRRFDSYDRSLMVSDKKKKTGRPLSRHAAYLQHIIFRVRRSRNYSLWPVFFTQIQWMIIGTAMTMYLALLNS